MTIEHKVQYIVILKVHNTIQSEPGLNQPSRIIPLTQWVPWIPVGGRG
jgi:hypothetical protein